MDVEKQEQVVFDAMFHIEILLSAYEESIGGTVAHAEKLGESVHFDEIHRNLEDMRDLINEL